MSFWFFLCLLIVVNSAIWVYFDASRLRDSRHTGIGPHGTPPQTWAAMTFLAWPVAFPYYLSKRVSSLNLEERSGPPPRFVTEGLTPFAMLIGLLGFAIFGGLLAIGELQQSIIGLVVAAAGIFGGRKTHMTQEQEKVELGSLGIEQIGFSAPAAGEDGGDEGEAPANIDQYFASMGRGGPAGPATPAFRSGAPAPRQQNLPPSNPSPDMPPPGVPYSPSLGGTAQPPAPQPPAPQPATPQQAAPQQAAPQQAAPQQAAPQPPAPQQAPPQPAAPQPIAPQQATPQPQQPPGVPYEPPPPGHPYQPPPVTAPPPVQTPTAPPPAAPPVGLQQPQGDPKATVALSPGVLQRHLSGTGQSVEPPTKDPGVSEAPSPASPEIFIPPDPVAKTPRDVPKPPTAARRELPRPPAKTRASSPGSAHTAGSYAFAAKESPVSQGLKIAAGILVAVGVVVLGWIAWKQWMPSSDDATANAVVEDSGLGDEVAQTERKPPPPPKLKNRREGGTLPPSAPETIDTVDSGAEPTEVTAEVIQPWTEEYLQWMSPLALALDEIDFEGIQQTRCRDLQKNLRAAESNISECPDSEIESLLRLALPILHSSADACRGENEDRWASSLLEAKKLTHKAQVLLDERYRFAGISELELESAIGVQRSPSSISGRWLIEHGDKLGDETFVDDDLESLLEQDGYEEDEDFEDDFSDDPDDEPLDDEEGDGFGAP